MGTRAGEMREWLNRAASKAVELLVSSEGSNPSLSERDLNTWDYPWINNVL